MIDPVDLLELPVLTSENHRQFDDQHGVRVLFDGIVPYFDPIYSVSGLCIGALYQLRS